MYYKGRKTSNVNVFPYNYTVYRSQLGPHHKLTLQAKEHLDNLTIQLGNNVVKC